MYAIGEPGFWPALALAVLATWRVTHLVAREDGPGDLIARLRERLGSSAAGALMDCFHCLSLWVAAPIALWITARPLDWLMTWLALSGAACLCERVGTSATLLQTLGQDTKGDDDGMLRTETRRDAERPAAVHEPRVGDREYPRH
jgi:hypothetical protein